MARARPDLEHAIRVYGPQLRRGLLFMTRAREQDADELLQRTFVRAWEKLDRFEDGDLFAWLKGIARMEYLTWLRGHSRRLRLASALTLEPLEPGEPALPSDELRWLDDCLGRLCRIDRQILRRFYGLRDPQEPAGIEAGPMSDAELSALLSAQEGQSWTPQRIRLRRFRALPQLRDCLRHHLEPGPSAGPAWEKPMRRPRSPDHPSALRLLELADRPHLAARAPYLDHLERCDMCRQRVWELEALDGALYRLAWEQAFESVADAPAAPLPEALVERLLETVQRRQSPVATPAMVEEARVEPRVTPKGGGLRLLDRPPPGSIEGPRTARVPRAALLAIAAMVLLTVGVLPRLRPPADRLTPAPEPGTPGWQLRGTGGPEAPRAEAPPLLVVVHTLDDRVYMDLEPRPLGDGRWRVEVPGSSLFQILVRNPLAGDEWRIDARCERPDRGAFLPGGGPDGRWSATAGSQALEAAVGAAISTVDAALAPGDRLVCRIERSAGIAPGVPRPAGSPIDRLELEVSITAPLDDRPPERATVHDLE